jgi:hypothetical protein
MQEKIKKKFPNLLHPLSLKDFNRLRVRKDCNKAIESLENLK